MSKKKNKNKTLPVDLGPEQREIRSLFMRGICQGKFCQIELSVAIGTRNDDGEYVSFGKIGDVVRATMFTYGWKIITPYEPIVIKLADGKVRT